MPLRALLMRLFMAAALLANGPGIAGASMHMEHLHDSPGDAIHVNTAPTAAGATADCHGAEASAPAAGDHHRPQAIEQAGAALLLDDCCQAGDCCACMHHCSAAIAGSPFVDVSLRYRKTAESFPSVHASAAVTNLFRPPIGQVS